MSEKTTIVIIEDNPDLRRVMDDYLQAQEDLEVVGCAADGNEGLEMVRAANPDVVLLDLIMPNCDGFGFMEALSRSQAPKPEIIVTSAIGQEDFIRRAIDLGARYYMVKPYDMDVLVKRVREMMLDKRAWSGRQSISCALGPWIPGWSISLREGDPTRPIIPTHPAPSFSISLN